MIPSLKYSCPGSPLKFSNGSTASMILPSGGVATGQNHYRTRKPAGARMMTAPRDTSGATHFGVTVVFAGSSPAASFLSSV